MEIKLVHDPNYITLIDSDENTIASLSYNIDGNIINANSTFVDPNHRSKGYAQVLVDELVAYARKENKKIVPICSYIVRLFENDNTYNDVYYKD